jgi:hypothetical protein
MNGIAPGLPFRDRLRGRLALRGGLVFPGRGVRGRGLRDRVFRGPGLRGRAIRRRRLRPPPLGLFLRWLPPRGPLWLFPVAEFSVRERAPGTARRPSPAQSRRALPIAGGIQPPVRFRTTLARPAPPGTCGNEHDDQRNTAEQAASYDDRASQNKQVPSGLSSLPLEIAEKARAQARYEQDRANDGQPAGTARLPRRYRAQAHRSTMACRHHSRNRSITPEHIYSRRKNSNRTPAWPETGDPRDRRPARLAGPQDAGTRRSQGHLVPYRYSRASWSSRSNPIPRSPMAAASGMMPRMSRQLSPSARVGSAS